MVEDADSFVIPQLSLDQVAISIFDSVRAVTQACPDRAQGGDKSQRSHQKLFHIPSRIPLTSYPNTSSASFNLGCGHPPFLQSVPAPEQCESTQQSNPGQRRRRPS